MEHVVRVYLGLPLKIISYNLLVFIQYIPSSIMNMLCILGTSATVLFKYQILENKRVSQMEQENIKSELDRLKEQISPIFLSNILNRTATLVKSEPSKAYQMLMKLGQLLRYQLYDSGRDKVLLHSEINFMKEYLELSQLYCRRLNYKLVVETGMKEMLISPLLFIPFIQQSVDKSDGDETLSLEIRFSLENSNLIFVCQSDYEEILSEDELFAIKKRLELIYSNNYSLSIERGTAILQLNNISEL
jgi:LytS/YehU family sensor histidine kinase